MRLRHDLAVGELAHLVAHRRQHLVEPAVADGDVVRWRHQFDQPRAALLAAGHQPFERAGAARSTTARRCKPEVGRAHDLALAHRNAAQHLRQIFAEPDSDQQLLDLAKRAGVMQRSA